MINIKSMTHSLDTKEICKVQTEMINSDISIYIKTYLLPHLWMGSSIMKIIRLAASRFKREEMIKPGVFLTWPGGSGPGLAISCINCRGRGPLISGIRSGGQGTRGAGLSGVQGSGGKF